MLNDFKFQVHNEFSTLRISNTITFATESEIPFTAVKCRKGVKVSTAVSYPTLKVTSELCIVLKYTTELNDESVNQSVKRRGICRQLLWRVYDVNETSKNTKQSRVPASQWKDSMHILISYNNGQIVIRFYWKNV